MILVAAQYLRLHDNNEANDKLVPMAFGPVIFIPPWVAFGLALSFCIMISTHL